ncbi:MAG TPA: hypothetical protein VK184_23525 [Nostocaceae cyanobacterium]|nr:hypothetical protein [Nostocaceae cyanobacterium]
MDHQRNWEYYSVYQLLLAIEKALNSARNKVGSSEVKNQQTDKFLNKQLREITNLIMSQNPELIPLFDETVVTNNITKSLKIEYYTPHSAPKLSQGKNIVHGN